MCDPDQAGTKDDGMLSMIIKTTSLCCFFRLSSYLLSQSVNISISELLRVHVSNMAAMHFTKLNMFLIITELQTLLINVTPNFLRYGRKHAKVGLIYQPNYYNYINYQAIIL